MHFLVETVPAEPSAPGTLTGAMRLWHLAAAGVPGQRGRGGCAGSRSGGWGTGGGHRREQAQPMSGR